MLPLPFTPAASWAMYRAHLAQLFRGAEPRVCIAFWFFGLINNILYIILLTATLDLVPPTTPKSLVLLCDVLPGFLVKLVLPYFIHPVPYNARIIVLVLLSTLGMLLVALSPSHLEGGTPSQKMAGVVLASLSSGAGESTFLGLTHWYGKFSLASWGSGTGAAGLVGAGWYAVCTTSFGLSSRRTLVAAAGFPVLMLLGFFVVLPKAGLEGKASSESSRVETRRGLEGERGGMDGDAQDEEDGGTGRGEEDGLLQQPSSVKAVGIRNRESGYPSWAEALLSNLRRSRALVIPYMLPLFLVYIAEYTINTLLAPTLLLFPLHPSSSATSPSPPSLRRLISRSPPVHAWPTTSQPPNAAPSIWDPPFTSYKSFYPTYFTLYQLFVFLSRSSLPLFRLQHLYPPALFQLLNLALLAAHALVSYIPTVWLVFVIVCWEGVLGGLAYVNTFARISEDFGGGSGGEREFALGAVSVSDSAGIVLAGVVGLVAERPLCAWQVKRGRGACEGV